MSKSLGTGIDPLELIDRYGADATRYGLLKMSSTQDVRFAEGAIDEGRALANKLWNASRLVLPERRPRGARRRRSTTRPIDRWILTRLRGDDRRRDRRFERIAFSSGVEGAVRVHLERLLRLVPRGRSSCGSTATTPRRARPASETALLRARADPRARCTR